MDKKTKNEFIEIVSEALDDVMVPALDRLEERLKKELASKEDVREISMRVESFERKFNAQQDRLDKHNERMEALEGIHPQGKHLFVAS